MFFSFFDKRYSMLAETSWGLSLEPFSCVFWVKPLLAENKIFSSDVFMYVTEFSLVSSSLQKIA